MKKLLLSLAFASFFLSTTMFQIFASGTGIAPNTGTAQAQTTSSTPTPTVTGNPDLAFLPTGFAPDLTALMTSLLSIVIAVMALLVFFYLVWGGFSWITSGGDKGKTEQARGKILAAVIGLIIVSASYAILLVLVRLLGYPSLVAVFEGIVPISGEGSIQINVPPAPTPTFTPTPSQ